MAQFVFGMNVSLDGYVDHDHPSFGPPGPRLFRHFIEQTRDLSGSLYGRRLYELMSYWDNDQPGWTADLCEFAEAWRRQPKWVVSRTLKSVGPNATLITGDVEAAVRKLKDELTGRIDVGGTVLAQYVGDLGLIDEYQLYYRPAVLGSGKPYFAGTPPRLRLVGNDPIGEDTVRLSYVPA